MGSAVREGETTSNEPDEAAALGAAIRNGDQSAFTALVGRRRRELLVHCYRMLASLSDAEDAVQETFLRAWRYRESVRDGLPLRPWLYRIATNACLDAIARDPRRTASAAASEAGAAGASGASADAPPADVAWLQPFPDALLEPVAPRESEPEAIALTRESVEIAFLTVIQRLSPMQRAALILRDVLGWSAKETAELLELSVGAANSALQRARATVRQELPPRRPAWPAGVDAAESERELVRRYVEAAERPDLSMLVSLIREDALFRMPPDPDVGVVAGRDAILRLFAESGFGTESFGRLRCVTTRANGLPAVAAYVRRAGDAAWSALAMDVLRIEEGAIAEILTFGPEVFAAFGLPPTLAAEREPELR
jgi:RNA polymerase sigma-70 factor (ECF subfamily)